MSAESIEKLIHRVIAQVARGSAPEKVVASVRMLVEAINEGRKEVVSDYLLELADRWPEGRTRLLAEVEEIDKLRQKTSETFEEGE